VNTITIYLANCLGFTPLFKSVLLGIVMQLNAAGFVVHEPFAECGKLIAAGKSMNPMEISAANAAAIRNCDVVVAIVDGWGNDVDAGVAWEMGYAEALGKRVYVLFTRNIERPKLNAQLCGPHTRFFTSMEELMASLN
jgi:nucleoside 2-deoxyribosyltransferase